jgi:hypothetical protein
MKDRVLNQQYYFNFDIADANVAANDYFLKLTPDRVGDAGTWFLHEIVVFSETTQKITFGMASILSVPSNTNIYAECDVVRATKVPGDAGYGGTFTFSRIFGSGLVKPHYPFVYRPLPGARPWVTYQITEEQFGFVTDTALSSTVSIRGWAVVSGHA